MPRSIPRYSPIRERLVDNLTEVIEKGETPSQAQLTKLLALSEFTTIFKGFRPQIAGMLVAKAIPMAMEGNVKMLTFMLAATAPEYFDAAVRVQTVANEGTWLNTLLEARIAATQVIQLKGLDPLSDEVKAITASPSDGMDIESTDKPTYQHNDGASDTAQLADTAAIPKKPSSDS